MPSLKRKKRKKRSTKADKTKGKVKIKIEKPILPEAEEIVEEVKDTRRKMTNPEEYERILNNIGIYQGKEAEFLEFARDNGMFRRTRNIRNQSR